MLFLCLFVLGSVLEFLVCCLHVFLDLFVCLSLGSVGCFVNTVIRFLAMRGVGFHSSL